MEPSAVVSKIAVRPFGPPDAVPDLFTLHEDAGIELRVLPELRTARPRTE